MKKLIFYILVSISILIIFSLQIHNAFTFDVTRGFDDLGHMEYVNLMKEQWRIPLPNEGWELYQPPFYYAVVSLLPFNQLIQWFGIFMWLLLVLAAYYFIYKIYNSKIFAIIGSVLVMSLPVVLYMSLSVGNEFASAVLISITLIYYLTIFLPKPSLKKIIFLAVLISLSLLTKATAFLLYGLLLFDLSRNTKITSKKKYIVTFSSVILIIAGWFYIRNLILFQNPFIASIDFPQYTIDQPPGYRDLAFFVNIKPFFTMDLFKAQYDSFIAGTYFSWFFDGHTIIVPVQEFSKAGVALILWTIPISILFIKGYINSLKKVTDINRILILYIPILLIAYILYNIKLPYYSTVKGSFIMSAVIPFIYFIIEGIKPFKKRYIIFGGYLFILSLLIIKNFWILDWWYQ